MSKTYISAEVREIIGVFHKAQFGAAPKVENMTTDGAKDLFSAIDLGSLAHWCAFSEVFAFAYDPTTLEIHAVVRTNDFFGNPAEDLVKELNDQHEGASVEVWGIRHRWGASVALPGAPECLESRGPRPSERSALSQVVAAAMEFEASPAVSPR